MDPRPRSPLPVAIAHDVPLSTQTRWLECDLYPGESYQVRALVGAGPETSEKAALVRFDMSTLSAGGTGISVSRALGAHTLLNTGSGLHRTDRVLTVRDRVRRIGLMASPGNGSVDVRTLTIERVTLDRPADFFLSFDVEAAPERASRDWIDRLVWGRIGGREYGISRICQILEEHGLIGNFMIDFVTCAKRGGAALQEIIDHLRGRGHEVHMHLHAEYLDPSLGYVLHGSPVQMDRTPFDMSRSLLEHALDSYTRFVGKGPYVFRAGGYRINDHAVRAAGDLGIHALTNVKSHTIGDIAAGGDETSYREPFVWDNGVIEIPVDVSSPEVSQFKNYLDRYRNALARKPSQPTFNVVMHSWSLLLRDRDGHHASPAPEYEDRLHQICAHAARHGRVRGYAEYLGTLPKELPVRRVAQIRVAQRPGRLTCNICDASCEGPDVASCPSCGLGVRHRWLRFVLDEYGDFFAGREVLGLDLTPAEADAFLGAASQVVRHGVAEGEAPDRVYDGVLWLRDPSHAADIAQVVDVVARTMKPGGVFAFVGSIDASEDGLAALRARQFVLARLPAIDPVTKTTGVISLAYALGGHVEPFARPEWKSRLHSLRLRLPALFRLTVEYVRHRAARHLSRRAKRVLRKVGALPRRGGRFVRRVVKRSSRRR